MQPLISINTITWNSEKKLAKCLDYLLKQSFPLDQLEVVLVDGGSSDRTVSLAQRLLKNKIKLKVVRTTIVDQEPKRAIAATNSSGKYICSLDPDVYLTDPNWLRAMIEPLESDATLIGSQTLHYCWNKNESAINRYFGLFGFNDPVAFYLGKADRSPHYNSNWIASAKRIVDKNSYFAVTLSDRIPTMGCNGVLYRRAIYTQFISDPELFFHIDIVQDIVQAGHSTIAIVKNCVLHSTGATFFSSIRKRIDYMSRHYVKKHTVRKFLVFDPKYSSDKFRLLLFIFLTITVIQPVWLSTRGFAKKPDFAWFLHWPICFGFLIAYSVATMNQLGFRLLFSNSEDRV